MRLSCVGLSLLVLGSGLVTGCRSVFGLDSPQRIDGGENIDDVLAADDSALVDAVPIDGNNCVGTGLVTFCPGLTAIPPAVTINGNINTSTDSRCRPESTAYCIIAADALTVDGNSHQMSGAKALVLVGMDTVTIKATVDLSSHNIIDNDVIVAEEIGAGEGTVAQCGTPPAGMDDLGDAGGGAGGSFGGRGGNGGAGSNGGGGAGATSLVAMGAPTVLRGGCPGSAGGDSGAMTGGAGGHGGGALYVIAGATLRIENTATLGAGGQGARAGKTGGSGGGGGGSGGFIGIDAPSIMCAGKITANGGGGGEGGALSGESMFGLSAINPDQQAKGGSANGAGGNGGNGSFTVDPNGTMGMSDTDAGGGGGGGAGVIKLYGGGSLAGCSVSPPAS